MRSRTRWLSSLKVAVGDDVLGLGPAGVTVGFDTVGIRGEEGIIAGEEEEIRGRGFEFGLKGVIVEGFDADLVEIEEDGFAGIDFFDVVAGRRRGCFPSIDIGVRTVWNQWGWPSYATE